MKTEVTILVVTYNNFPYFKATLESIERNTLVPYKLMVVNNGSCSKTANYLIGKNIEFLTFGENIGYIEAQSLAFSRVKTKYLCSCNDDIWVSKGWLKRLLNELNRKDEIKISAPIKWSTSYIYPYDEDCNCRQVWENIKLNQSGNLPEELLFKFTRGNSLRRFGELLVNKNNLHRETLCSIPDFVPGFCFITEVKNWNKIGGFVDNQMQTYGAEDVERCWRLFVNGYKILRTPFVYVHHFEGVSVKKNRIDISSVMVKNNRILLNKYRKHFYKWLRKRLLKSSLKSIYKNYWLVEYLLNSATNLPPDIQKRRNKLND